MAGLESWLNERIFGQSLAIARMTSLVRRGELGYAKPGRPRGSMLFLGPTGVGKTESVLALGRYLYDSTEKIARFDMAEYQDDLAFGRLIGRNRDEQGHLGDAIDRLTSDEKGGIILFDEIEKAHPDLVKVFLGLFDAARLTTSNGSLKNAENLYLICTSNLGSAEAIKMGNMNPVTVERTILQIAMQQFFSPEIFARFQERIVFMNLGYNIQKRICETLIQRELLHLKAITGVPINIVERVVPVLIAAGYNPMLGARPMRDAVERMIGNAVAEMQLSNSAKENGWVLKPSHDGKRLLCEVVTSA